MMMLSGFLLRFIHALPHADSVQSASAAASAPMAIMLSSATKACHPCALSAWGLLPSEKFSNRALGELRLSMSDFFGIDPVKPRCSLSIDQVNHGLQGFPLLTLQRREDL